MQEPSSVPAVESSDTIKGTSAGNANENAGTGHQANGSMKKARIEKDRIQSSLNEQDSLRKTTEQFLQLLRDIAPVLFTVEAYNQKFLKDMEYGEIHIIEYVRNGKVYKIDGYPRISRIIDQT